MEQKLILFDFDGTLFDSRNIILRAMEMTFQKCDIPPPKPQDVLQLVGISLNETMHILAEKSGSKNPENTAKNLITIYREIFTTLRQSHLIDDPMFDGAYDMIVELAQYQNLILGIATGKSRRGVLHLLERENLTQFNIIQTADDAPSKPNPAMIHNALYQSQINPENALIVGDTTFDIHMGKNAGIQSIAVLWGYHSEQELKHADPDAICKNMTELKIYLMRFLKNQSIRPEESL